MTIRIDVATKSALGRARTRNEDVVLVADLLRGAPKLDEGTTRLSVGPNGALFGLATQGASAVTAIVVDRHVACISEAGSARAYVLRGGSLQRLAVDEAFVPCPGDCLVVASDGLTRKVSTEEIASEILTTPSLVYACDSLVALAHVRGGENLTLLLACIREEVLDDEEREEDRSGTYVIAPDPAARPHAHVR